MPAAQGGEHWASTGRLSPDDARTLMGLAGMAEFHWDSVSGVSLSKEAEALLGVAPGRVRDGADFQALCHPDDHDRVRATMGDAFRCGGSGRIELRMKRADGRWLHLRAVYRTECRPEGSHAILGLLQDISELAEARDAAVGSERQVRGLVDEARIATRRLKLALGAAEAGVFEIDHAAEAFWCSPEFVRLVGRRLTYAEACAMPWPMVHAEDHQVVLDASPMWRSGRSAGDPMEVRVRRPDGELRWMRIYYELRRDVRGRARRSVGLVLDVDERKRQELALMEAERAAQAGAEAKSHFLASMSHEIRTPLNGVLGVIHLLRNEADISGDGRGLLDEAMACGHMLSCLINDILDLSKIEADEMELTLEATDPVQTLQGVIRLLQPQADAKGLYLNAHIEQGLGWVQADPVRLRQALFNLIGNAVKFTNLGGVTVRLGAADDGQRLRFEIQDTGVGIPDDAHDRVFERFHQADSSTTRRYGGTGLGLTITRRLAEMMGGKVGFDSVVGVGSTFWMEIAAPAVAVALPSVPKIAGDLAGARVLVVEDNATNRLIARKLLEAFGADVVEAEDGENGVASALSQPLDLVLMDVQMPGMDGLEATRRIRAAELGPRLPIIALTANVLAHQLEGYRACGMDGVIAKPVSPSDLAAEICRVLTGVDRAAAVA